MKSKLVALLLVGASPFAVFAQTAQETELKKLQDELALEKAKNDLFAARYPKFEGGKSGTVEGAEKLTGMASQLLPKATSTIGELIAAQLTDTGRCANGTVLVSGASIDEKIATAVSFIKQIQLLEEKIAEARPKGIGLSGTATVVAAMGAFVSYAGMFKSNYTVSDATLAIDEDWLVASIVLRGTLLESDRFPNRRTVEEYISKLDSMRANAQGITNSKKKTELTKQVDDLRAAMFKPDANGILPIVTTALLSPVVAKDPPKVRAPKCLAFISSTKASPLLLTRETIFGKGGRAFLHLPVQASVIHVDGDGKPIRMICKLATVSAPIKVSDLTKIKDAPIPWSAAETGDPKEGDCGTWPATPDNKGDQGESQIKGRSDG